MINSPVLLLIFNRPKHTSTVFEAIRMAKPPKLYIAADGPRAEYDDDPERCEEARLIATQVDWPCEVITNFRQRNLGCKLGVSSGITWFFNNEEQGVILEDDCLPNQEFFWFCDTLLDHYKSNIRIWSITGNNFQKRRWRGNASYYFSKYNHCWGWASWRRAWQHFDVEMRFWDSWQNSVDWQKTNPNLVERQYWERIFNSMRKGEIDSWGYAWTAYAWYNGGLTITPNVNLVTNIGIGPEATRTKARHDRSGIPSESLGLISHPECIDQDISADQFTFDNHFEGKKLRWPWRGPYLAKAALRRILRP